MATPLMQTPISPLLPSPPASGTAATTKAATPPYQFQQTLSRQIEQRQVASKLDQDQTRGRIDAQAKAQTSADAKAAQPDQPAAPAAESNATAEAKTDTKTDNATDTPAKADDGRAENSETAPSALNDMLALVASMQQSAPLARAAALAPAQRQSGADVGAGVGAGAGPGAGHGRAAALSGAQAASLGAATDALDAGAARVAATNVDAGSVNPDGFNAAKINAEVALSTLAGKAAGPDLSATGNQVTPLQQAAQQIAQTAASVIAPDQLASRVGSAAWDQQLGQKVVWMVAGGVQSASLTLNPPDLGPLQVVLSISNDEASASFTSAQPEVRQALEAALPKLREMMSEAGINLGNASVSSGMSDQNQAAERGQRMNERSDLRGSAGGNGDESTQRQGTASVRAAALRGIVDTFA